MIAIIDGNPSKFRPLVNLYREAGKQAGHSPESLKVGIHALGYVADTDAEAADDIWPGYERLMTKIGKSVVGVRHSALTLMQSWPRQGR